MYGKSINMVRCIHETGGKPCNAMISIPQGEKGVCPKCGHLYRGLPEYYHQREQVRNKSAVQPLGTKTGLS